MNDIRKDLDQLGVAGELIDKNKLNIARLGLFLPDNLAELIMYRKVMLEISRDDHFRMIGAGKYSTSKRRKIFDYFMDKVTFLVYDLKKISESDGFVRS